MIDLAEIRDKYPDAGTLTDDQFIDFAAKKYGTTPDIFKEAIGYKPPVEGTFQSVKRGAGEAITGLKNTGIGLLAGAAGVTEKALGEGGLATGVKNYALDKYDANAQAMAAQAQPNDELDTAYEKAKQGDIGALGSWFAHGVGNLGTQALGIAATGGVGGMGAKVVAKQVVDKYLPSLVAKEVAAISAKPIGQGLSAEALQKLAVSNIAEKVGAQAALAATSFGLEGGEIAGDTESEARKTGHKMEWEDYGRVLAATLIAGSLEYAGNAVGFGAMRGKLPFSKSVLEAGGIGGRAVRGAVGIGAAAPMEYAQEFGQTLAEEYGKGKDPFTPEVYRQARNAASARSV